jgi:Outer membrane protein beta-barrel domain
MFWLSVWDGCLVNKNKASMRKLFLLNLLIWQMMFCATAQISFGFRAGLHSSYVSSNIAQNNFLGTGILTQQTAVLGYHFGGIVNFRFSKHLALQPSVLFCSRGSQYKTAMNEGNIRLQSLELPVLLLYTADSGAILGGGISFHYNLSGKINNTTAGTSTDIAFGDATNQIKSTDLAYNIVAGYRWKNGYHFLFTYSAGLSNQFNSSLGYYRNNLLALSVGYVFKNKKIRGKYY